MAKFDQADPRWIVEIRNEDAHNLNQWHWTDKSLLPWCEAKLKELFPEDHEFGSTPLYVCYFSKVEHVKGDVSLMLRKGRSVVTYEIDLKLAWRVRSSSDGETVAEGSCHMPYISDENDHDDFEIKWHMTTAASQVADDARSKAHDLAKPLLKKRIPQFLSDLLSSHSSKHGAQLSSSSSSSIPTTTSSSSSSTPSAPSLVKGSGSSGQIGVPLAKTGSSGLPVQVLKQSIDFAGPPGELFECFADVRRVSVYAGSDTKLSFAVGGEFSLFDGNITGKIVDIQPRQKLAMTWRFSAWPAGHYSMVTLSFAPSAYGTTVGLVQESIPVTEIDATRDGWNRFYWERISACFGCAHKQLPI